MNTMKDATCGVGFVYLGSEPQTSVYREVDVAQSFVFYVVFCELVCFFFILFKGRCCPFFFVERLCIFLCYLQSLIKQYISICSCIKCRSNLD